MEWAKFLAVFLFIFSGMVILFYAGLMVIWHFRIKRRDREIEEKLERRVF